MNPLLARGAGWIAAGRVLVNLLSLASTLMLARLLMPEDFGLIAIATAIAAIAAAMTELSLSSALVQHRDPQSWHYDTVWTLGVARSLLLGVVMAAMAWPVTAIYGDARLMGVMLAFAALNALGGFGNPRLAMFARELIFWQDFVLGVSGKLIGFIAGVAVAYVFRSYWALVAGMFAGQLWGLAVGYALKPAWPRLSLRGGRELFRYSAWLSLGQIVRQLGWKSDQFLIGYAFGPAQLGIYNYGDNLAALPTREATAPIGGVLFPAFSRMADEQDRLRHAYERAQVMLFTVALPVGVGFALVADPFVRLVLGDRWIPAIFVVQVLATTFAAHTLTGPSYPLAMAMGETRDLLRRDTWILLIGLVLMLGGVLSGGLAGVIWSRVIGSVIGTHIDMALVKRLIGLPIARQWSANARTILAVSGMALAVLTFQHLCASNGFTSPWVILVGSVGIGGLAHSVLAYLIWTLWRKPDGPERQIMHLASATISVAYARLRN